MEGTQLYQAIGGTAACRKLAEAFYARVDRDPVLRPFFPGKTHKCAIEEFSAFLAQFLGGPTEDAQRRWWLSLRESHLRFPIGQPERDAWMKNMIHVLGQVPMEESARIALRDFFEQSSAYIVNVGHATEPRPKGADACPFHQEISRRWTAQLALDEAVAAVKHGDAHRAIALAAQLPLKNYLHDNRSVLAFLLALMIARGDPTMLDYVRTTLVADPALVHERYNGRTLLHGAAAAGNLAMVELLLRLGAGPDTKDGGGHTPLYSVANECHVPGGGDVVRALIKAGARVDACDGVKRCTPLHMAARRDNVEVAEALLDCGANLEAPDSLGETPLRRSVNCNQTGVAALLLARGADIHSRGSKGKTPLSAARTPAMRRLML